MLSFRKKKKKSWRLVHLVSSGGKSNDSAGEGGEVGGEGKLQASVMSSSRIIVPTIPTPCPSSAPLLTAFVRPLLVTLDLLCRRDGKARLPRPILLNPILICTSVTVLSWFRSASVVPRPLDDVTPQSLPAPRLWTSVHGGATVAQVLRQRALRLPRERQGIYDEAAGAWQDASGAWPRPELQIIPTRRREYRFNT